MDAHAGHLREELLAKALKKSPPITFNNLARYCFGAPRFVVLQANDGHKGVVEDEGACQRFSMIGDAFPLELGDAVV